MTLRPPRDPDRDRAESIDLVNHLLATIPETRELLNDHMRTSGELLPCVLVGDVARWFIELYRDCTSVARPSAPPCALFDRLGDFFEVSFRDLMSDAVGDVIGTCFLEDLRLASDDYAGLKVGMARWPTLKAWLDQYG